jgi:hypothetical protein
MKLFRICLVSLAASALLAAPARAQTGNGLYEPFPTPSSDAVARAFVDRIGSAGLAGVTTDDLVRGLLVERHAPSSAVPAAVPSARGGRAGSGFSPSLGWPLALALLALAAGAARTAAARRA